MGDGEVEWKMEKQNVVRQAHVNGMSNGDFPLRDFIEEIEWMDTGGPMGLGPAEMGSLDRSGKSVLEAFQCK